MSLREPTKKEKLVWKRMGKTNKDGSMMVFNNDDATTREMKYELNDYRERGIIFSPNPRALNLYRGIGYLLHSIEETYLSDYTTKELLDMRKWK